MPFLHPALLWWGAGAASVPIIIHLLNRRRFKILDWAAMRFLLDSVRKNRRRVRLEELILLALRCLAILLLTAAVARFLGCAPSQILPVGTAPQTTHVFILDDSASVGQKLADTTAFNKAANDLADLLGRVRPGDRTALLLTSRPDRSEALFNLNVLTEPEALAGRLRTLKAGDTVTQLHKALRTAGEMFEEVATVKRLYVLSDFRRADYSGSSGLEDVRKELRGLADRKVELVLLSYGPKPAGNLTVDSIEMLDKLAVVGVPVRVQVTVRNNGPQRAENVPVEFVGRAADGAELKLPVRTLKSVEAGESQTVVAECAFADAGSAVLEVRLPADALAADNTARLAVEVRQARKLLIVDGEPDPTDPTACESFYLASALDPTGDHRHGNDVEVVGADRLGELSFDRYDMVVLANVGEIPQSLGADGKLGYGILDALRKYVNNGGGLLIFAGTRTNPTFYNGPFHDAGAGLCPVRVGAPAGDVRTRQSFVRLQRDSIANDPMMRSFQGKRSQFTQLVRFYGYLPVEESAGAAGGLLGAVRVLARFDNATGNVPHSPAVVARSYGYGQVVMVCSSADKDWSDWPKDFTFVTFVNDVAEQISRPGGRDFTALVGARIDYTAGQELASARASLQTPAFPAEDVLALEGRPVGSQRQITYENPRHAGVYELKLTGGEEEKLVLYARNVDPVEGRLETAGESDLSGQLGVKFEYIDKLAGPAAGGPTTAKGQEFWKAALAAMLIVLALEVYLGQRFGHYQS